MRVFLAKVFLHSSSYRCSQDDSREGTKDDIPFEFKHPDNPTATEMDIGFFPLDLLAFLGYSYELLEVFWHAFKGDHDNAAHHAEWFMTLAA